MSREDYGTRVAIETEQEDKLKPENKFKYNEEEMAMLLDFQKLAC